MKVVKLSSFAKSGSKPIPTGVVPDNKSKPKKKGLNNTDVITVDFTTIVDLNRIDAHVRNIFEIKKKTLESKQQTLMSSGETLENQDSEDVLYTRYLASLFDEIEKLESEILAFDEYFNIAPQFLELYESLLPSNRTKTVGENDIVVDFAHEKPFLSIVTQFIELAMRYTAKIKVVNKTFTVEKCTCGGSTMMVDGTIFCVSCGIKVKSQDQHNGYQSSGSEYHRLETFEDGLDHICGHSRKPIPPHVYESITKHCELFGVSEENLTKQEIIGILRKAKLSEFYKSINLIRHTIQDRKLPCYDHIRSVLLERHRLIENEYMEIRTQQGRNNFLNVYFVIRACIQMEGQPLDPDDFIVLTTVEALKDHNRIMHIICDRIKERQKGDKSIKGSWDFVSIMN